MICQVQRWKDLDCWIPVTLALPQLRSGDYVPLSSLLSITRAPIDLKRKPISTLSIIRKISFGGTIEVRTEKEKEGYKGNLFLAEAGYLIISKINFIHGSFCVVPNDVGPVAVSSEYPTFAIDRQRISSDYLNLVLRTDAFRNQLTRIRSGSAKKRVQATSVLNKAIPLPSPDAQRQMVTAYQKFLDKAAELEAQALQIERDAQLEFETALGLTPPLNLPKHLFQIAHFKDIERWSHRGILQDAVNRTGRHDSAFDQHLLGEVAKISHGCSHPPSAKPTALEILKISAVTRGHFYPQERKFIKDNHVIRTRFDLRGGDILMCRTNGTLSYVGMAALVTEAMPDLIFPDKVIRVRLTTGTVLPDFLWTLLKTRYMRMKIEACARTAVGNYAIGSSDLAALDIVVPPMQIQESISKLLSAARKWSDSKRKQAATLRAAAWNDFIAAVFT